MLSIGQLILCRDKSTAEKIIKSLLVISLSKLTGDKVTYLKISLQYINNLILEETPQSNEIRDIVETSFVDDDLLEADADVDIIEESNTLGNWAKKLQLEADIDLAKEEDLGDDINPRFCPEFASRLLKQLSTIPMWSCISRDLFGYGKVPPSSAPVESEINI